MAERKKHFEADPRQYSQEFSSLITHSYHLKGQASGENDVNGIMFVKKGRIKNKDIIIFDIGIDHDQLLTEVKKERRETVIFTYEPPFQDARHQGSILVVATHLSDDIVQTGLDFVINSWPKELDLAKIHAISPGTVEDFPFNEHVIFNGSVRAYNNSTE